ncbi:YifB family Mg chelatase-like AAA ATPase [Calidifontibacter terrae]
MTLGVTRCVAVYGITGRVVTVEADTGSGTPIWQVVGLPDSACKQAPDRIKAAAANTDLELPKVRVTVNLSPADLTKQGSGYDLAIAVAALVTNHTIEAALVRDVVHLGELGLDGSVRPIRGMLPAALAAREAGFHTLLVPVGNAREAMLISGIEVVPVQTLAEVVGRYRCLKSRREPPAPPPLPAADLTAGRTPDMADVIGQPEARFALEVAAAGFHHVSMVGPPGAGKTMLAERMVGLLPPLVEAEALQTTAIHSVLGLLRDGELIRTPPFVAPHHGVSLAAMVGGGSGRVRPGAVSQANAGVLFVDECAEARRDVMDALRQPLESGTVTINRASGSAHFPARFLLVLAANPCPCGLALTKSCRCSPLVLRNYRARLSGPLMDRIDVQLRLRAVTRASGAAPGEPTATIAQRVNAAREQQRRRWRGQPWATNGRAPGAALRRGPWLLPPATTAPLDEQLRRGVLTLRGYDRCLRLAWTLGDLAGAQRPSPTHVLQAFALRAGQAAA